ncbi:MAG: hypothetical protein HW380_85 [Magnetococcales bacterium]|nr:hypothetical protein [Magnetococcales bacterium]
MGVPSVVVTCSLKGALPGEPDQEKVVFNVVTTEKNQV